MAKRLQMVCRYCGSSYIVKDAWACWSVEAQRWELDNFYDATQCNSCDGESKWTAEVDLDALPTLEAALATPEDERGDADRYVIFMDEEAKSE